MTFGSKKGLPTRASFRGALIVAVIAFAAAGPAADAEDQIDDLDALFDDPSSTEVVEAVTVEDPAGSLMEEKGVVWGGKFDSKLESNYAWEEVPSSADGIADGSEGLDFTVAGTLFFDARPDADFRVFGKLSTAFPFHTDTALNNIKLFELFSDFNVGRTVYFRFGKQTAAWGLSRFYQIADPLSVAVKDPQDPEADLEGPLALKASLPIGGHTLFAYIVAKESYLPEDLSEASIADLGYGLKGDFLIRMPENPLTGDAELTVAAYYQRELAPAFTFGLSSNIGKAQIFTDQVLSWGLNRYRLSGDVAVVDPGLGQIYDTEKADEGLYYAATVGFSYANSDLHLSVYGEYYFDASGSAEDDYLEKLANRYFWESANLPPGAGTLSILDLVSYQGAHNSTIYFSFDELFGSDDWTASVYWQANWVDLSGLVIPTLTLSPNERVGISLGCRLAYGDDRDEFVVKTSDPSSFEARRATVFLAARLGSGAF